MKKGISIGGMILLLLLGGPSVAVAQTLLPDIHLPDFITISDSTAPVPLTNAFRVDYTVPDGPAFSLVDVDASNILRPATIRELAASVTSFTDDDGFSIPRTFAVEFAPGLLIGGKHLTLGEYRRNPLNWIRLSAATKRLAGAANPSELALGLRFSIKDKADPRRNDDLLVGLDSLNQLIFDAITALPPAMQLAIPSNQALTPDQLYQALPDSVQTRIQALVAARVVLLNEQAQINSSETWNNSAIDLATAVRFSTADSLGRGIEATDIAAWLTAAVKIQTWGQVLFGVKGSLARDTSFVENVDNPFGAEGSAGMRLYIGTNRYKMFTEAQFETEHRTDDRMETLLLNGGGEARLQNGTWIEFGGGLQYNFLTEQWDVVSKFSLKLGLPFLRSSP